MRTRTCVLYIRLFCFSSAHCLCTSLFSFALCVPLCFSISRCLYVCLKDALHDFRFVSIVHDGQDDMTHVATVRIVTEHARSG